MFTYAYAKSTWLFKATNSLLNRNGASCPWLHINVCVRKVRKYGIVLKSHIYLSNTCDPLSNTQFLYAQKKEPEINSENSFQYKVCSLFFGAHINDYQTQAPVRNWRKYHSVTTLTFICEEGFKYSLISKTRSSWAFGYNSEVITTFYLTKMHNYERIHSSIWKPEY